MFCCDITDLSGLPTRDVHIKINFTPSKIWFLTEISQFAQSFTVSLFCFCFVLFCFVLLCFIPALNEFLFQSEHRTFNYLNDSLWEGRKIQYHVECIFGVYSNFNPVLSSTGLCCRPCWVYDLHTTSKRNCSASQCIVSCICR